jgi:hypothetical protein
MRGSQGGGQRQDLQSQEQGLPVRTSDSPVIIFKHCRELLRPVEAKKWFAIEPEATNVVVALLIPSTLDMRYNGQGGSVCANLEPFEHQ